MPGFSDIKGIPLQTKKSQGSRVWVDSRYEAAFLKNVGLSEKQPIPQLQAGQTSPLIFPVWWQWSITNLFGSPQIAHRPFCFCLIVSRSLGVRPYSYLSKTARRFSRYGPLVHSRLRRFARSLNAGSLCLSQRLRALILSLLAWKYAAAFSRFFFRYCLACSLFSAYHCRENSRLYARRASVLFLARIRSLFLRYQARCQAFRFSLCLTSLLITWRARASQTRFSQLAQS